MRTFSIATVVLVINALLLTPHVRAADHTDAPLVRTDGTVDINDLYVFQSPSNSANVVLVMTVNPFAGVRSGTVFNTRAVYEFDVDMTGDAVADAAYRFYFSAERRGVQRFIVVGPDGAPMGTGQTGASSSLRGGGRVTAGLFDDPFFFDSVGFNNGLRFTGADSFANANISAIVLELPRSSFASNNLGVWARTVLAGSQFDRVGRPAINTVLIPSAKKNAFNFGAPVNDTSNFGMDVQATLVSLGNSAQRAAALTAILLPDILTVDISNPSGFLNGRRLADDVIDAELSLLTDGAIAGDGVNQNDKAFSDAFPYLASPH